MDWVKLHLALNHISVIGTPFLLLLLMWAWARRAEAITRLSLEWTVAFAVLSIALKFTGDFAAEQGGQKFDPVRPFVNRHEQAADQATTAVFLLGLAASVALFIGRGGRRLPTWALAAVLAVGILTFFLLARTAHLGGQITHPELRSRISPFSSDPISNIHFPFQLSGHGILSLACPSFAKS